MNCGWENTAQPSRFGCGHSQLHLFTLSAFHGASFMGCGGSKPLNDAGDPMGKTRKLVGGVELGGEGGEAGQPNTSGGRRPIGNSWYSDAADIKLNIGGRTSMDDQAGEEQNAASRLQRTFRGKRGRLEASIMRDQLVRAATRWRSHRMGAAWTSWVAFASERTVMASVAVRWAHRAVADALVIWKDCARSAATMLKVAMRWSQRASAAAFSAWSARAAHKKHSRRIGTKALLRYLRGEIARAFVTWSFHVVEAAQEREAAQQAATARREEAAADRAATWFQALFRGHIGRHLSAEEASASGALMEKSCAIWEQHAVGRAWRSWAEAAADGEGLRRALARWENAAVAMAMATWKEAVAERLILENAAVKWVLLAQSVAMRTWCEYAAERERFVGLGQQVVAQGFRRALLDGLMAWVDVWAAAKAREVRRRAVTRLQARARGLTTRVRVHGRPDGVFEPREDVVAEGWLSMRARDERRSWTRRYMVVVPSGWDGDSTRDDGGRVTMLGMSTELDALTVVMYEHVVGDVSMSGWLMKKSGGWADQKVRSKLAQKWDRRWFVLRSLELSYYRTPADEAEFSAAKHATQRAAQRGGGPEHSADSPRAAAKGTSKSPHDLQLGVLNCEGAKVFLKEVAKGGVHRFTLHNSAERELKLRAANNEVYESWAAALQQAAAAPQPEAEVAAPVRVPTVVRTGEFSLQGMRRETSLSIASGILSLVFELAPISEDGNAAPALAMTARAPTVAARDMWLDGLMPSPLASMRPAPKSKR